MIHIARTLVAVVAAGCVGGLQYTAVTNCNVTADLIKEWIASLLDATRCGEFCLNVHLLLCTQVDETKSSRYMIHIARTLVAVVAAGCIGGLQYTAVTNCNVTADLIKDWIASLLDAASTTGQVNIIYALIVGMFGVGLLPGALLTATVSATHSRLQCLYIGGTTCAIGATMASLCKVAASYSFLIFGRFVHGLGAGLTISVSSMYISEIPPERIRGACGATTSSALAFGCCAGVIFGLPETLGTADLWPVALSLPGFMAVLGMALALFLKESPSYSYIVEGNKFKAWESLTFFQSDADAEASMRSLEEENRLLRNIDVYGVSKLVKDKSLRTFLIVVVLANISCAFSGINGIMEISSSVFHAAGLNWHSAKYLSLGLVLTNTLASTLAPFASEALGRRKSYMIGLYGSVISTSAGGIFFGISYYAQQNMTTFAYLTAISMYTFVMLFMAMEAVVVVMACELFHQGARDAAVTVAMVVYFAVAAAESVFYPLVFQVAGETVCLVPFIVLPLVCSIYVLRHLPETAGKSIAHVATFGGEQASLVSNGTNVADYNSLTGNFDGMCMSATSVSSHE